MAETTTTMDLLTAAFSAMLNTKVVPHDKVPEAGVSRIKISVHDLFRATYYIGGMQFGTPKALDPEAAGQKFPIIVRTLTGATIDIPVTQDHTIAQIKAAVEAETDIPTSNQRLVFNSSTLHDHHTVGGLGMLPNAYCCLIKIDGEDVTKTEFHLDPSDLAPEYDYDFTDMHDDGERYERGWNYVDKRYFVYTRPYGWKRFALNVKGQYYGGDTWLGPNGIRTDSASGEWPVCYHGTGAAAAGSIKKKGYDPAKCTRKAFGPGIYCSPDIENDANYYAQTFTCNHNEYEVVLQNRVNPEKIGKQNEDDPGDPDRYGDCSLVLINNDTCSTPFEYWRCPRQKPRLIRYFGYYDIRPYGILIRKK